MVCKEISLSQGKMAIVDSEDYDRLLTYKWHFYDGYARRSQWVSGDRTSKGIYMHHEILGVTPGGKFVVDHINGNSLDNRKENLRVVTQQQNLFNSRPHRKALSKYKGVSWHKPRGKWRAKIMLNGRSHHIGYFCTEIDAALAYNEYAQKMFGEYAWARTVN